MSKIRIESFTSPAAETTARTIDAIVKHERLGDIYYTPTVVTDTRNEACLSDRLATRLGYAAVVETGPLLLQYGLRVLCPPQNGIVHWISKRIVEADIGSMHITAEPADDHLLAHADSLRPTDERCHELGAPLVVLLAGALAARTGFPEAEGSLPTVAYTPVTIPPAAGMAALRSIIEQPPHAVAYD